MLVQERIMDHCTGERRGQEDGIYSTFFQLNAKFYQVDHQSW